MTDTIDSRLKIWVYPSRKPPHPPQTMFLLPKAALCCSLLASFHSKAASWCILARSETS